jgi:cyclophilin family peptidyl-prolyl cis-trans isomerase
MKSLRFVFVSALAFGLACAKTSAPPAPLSIDAGSAVEPHADTTAIARAEDQRRAGDVGERALTSHDVVVRRLAARALARIADDASESGLYRALSDEDSEVAAWGAYGLGFSCKGKEDAHVAALAARAASIDEKKLDPAARIDLRTTLARAVGRCGSGVAERLLATWVRARDSFSEPATYGLGDIANKKGALADETTTTLLEATAPSPSGPPLGSALYPFSRVPHVIDAFAQRVLEAARDGLGNATPTRIFSVRALARVGPLAAADLSRVAGDNTFSAVERAEAARGLGQLGLAGKQGASDALVKIVGELGSSAARYVGDLFIVVDTLLNDLGADAPSGATRSLQNLVSLTPPDTTTPLALRLSTLHCDAAAALANKAYDAAVVTHCDLNQPEVRERATLRVLLRRPLVADRRKAWIAFAKSDHVRVREDALEAIGDHPEIGDAARIALQNALISKQAGIVTTAADLIKGHPDRVLVVSAKARAASLDPNSPPPKIGTAPARELDPDVAHALSTALGQAWAEDLVETRIALIDASVAVDLDGAREAAASACRDANVTLRDAGKKALAALGQPYAACVAPDPPPPAASEIDSPMPRATKITFASDAGPLTIHLDPLLAPISTARIVALAQSGFFHGILVHRVVPGFVAQFGDPEGDGFGGSGKLLRCETSPVSFNALDVGIALAGRDTGSSQLFVTLSRTPHLDGEYTHVGRADGDWGALVEGDAIGDAKIEDE